MCILCSILGLGTLDYLEVSAGALQNNVVTVFGLVALVPPALIPIWTSGNKEPALFYN